MNEKQSGFYPQWDIAKEENASDRVVTRCENDLPYTLNIIKNPDKMAQLSTTQILTMASFHEDLILALIKNLLSELTKSELKVLLARPNLPVCILLARLNSSNKLLPGSRNADGFMSALDEAVPRFIEYFGANTCANERQAAHRENMINALITCANEIESQPIAKKSVNLS